MTTTAPIMSFNTKDVGRLYKRLVNPNALRGWFSWPGKRLREIPVWEYTIAIFPTIGTTIFCAGCTIHITHPDGRMLTAKVIDRGWTNIRIRTQETTETWSEQDFIHANYIYYGEH